MSNSQRKGEICIAECVLTLISQIQLVGSISPGIAGCRRGGWSFMTSSYTGGLLYLYQVTLKQKRGWGQERANNK